MASAIRSFAPSARPDEIHNLAEQLRAGAKLSDVALPLVLPESVIAFLKRHRLPADAPPEAAELAGLALMRMVDVLMQRVGFRLAASVMKAAQALRDEVCGPLPTETKLSGGMTLEALVIAAGRQANAQIAAERAAQAALPPASGEEPSP